MSYVKGKFKQLIFESNTGYKIGLIKVLETDDNDIKVNKLLTFTGFFSSLIIDENYLLNGEYVYNERYGYQFNCKSYEKIIPTGKDAIIEFLTSSFVKGCGSVLAKKIYNLFGDEALNKIKEDKNNLLLIPKISEKKALSIYNSIVKYFDADKEILELKNMGFTIKETMNLINKYGKNVKDIIDTNIYVLKDLIDFKKLDSIFLINNNYSDKRRVKACIIETMKSLTFINGDIYLSKVEIVEYLNKNYNIDINIDEELVSLSNDKQIMIINGNYYLMDDYLDELNNSINISFLYRLKEKKLSNFDELVSKVEKNLKIEYNKEQKEAIKMALTNNISIITGGPGTGKTTIIKGILKLYSSIHNLDNKKLMEKVMLLAPTGRASKRMSETCNLPASTIHRFLKWDKENNSFKINEFNKLHYSLFIIDEVSMIDNHLLASLFKGIDKNTQIIFVGDEYQLPSVGPGLILQDMINSGIKHIRLEEIYRQSNNSFIPILAKEIKNTKLTNDYKIKKDDYNFIFCDKKQIKDLIKDIYDKAKDKNIDIKTFQILAPMYKGENGIDNLNNLLQSIINPSSKNKNEVKIGSVIYRENDKVLNLVNDVEANVYNGDIGYITEINAESKQDFLIVNYDGHLVSYQKDEVINITHAYAISIHKSQGSEFDHVIMPFVSSYNRMLYNKLIYTGVSRAKKSLILIGEEEAFLKAVNNNYSLIRKTTLKSKILNNLSFNDNNNYEEDK